MVSAGATVHQISRFGGFNVLAEYLASNFPPDPAIVKLLLKSKLDIRPDVFQSGSSKIAAGMVVDKFMLIKVKQAVA